MNAKTTRIYKETRALFWPWCAVTIVGVLPLVHVPHWSGDLILVWYLLGFLILATLPFGNEFQHRTLSLLLAQPVERMEIWSEKLSVMAVAVLSALLVSILAWRVSALQLDPHDAAFFGAWIIATAASATFWTLVARSTLGGLALNVSINALVIEMPWLVLYHEKLVTVSLPPSNITVATITFVLLCYAGVMLGLGRLKLARFQARGGVAGDDLLMSGPNVMPEAMAGWFRCRPTGAFLNLIRKELRLLRPLWLITPLAVMGWTFVTMSGLIPERGSTRILTSAEASAFALSVISALIIAVLAGSLSLGEERTSGTHAWHMTLPVSVRRQWLIKLLMALFAGIVCAVLLPGLALIAGGIRFGSPLKFVDPHAVMIWLLVVAVVTFASFWCACVVNGTVRAALWLFPALIAVGLASVFGDWAGRELVNVLVARSDAFASFRFAAVVSRLGPNALFRLVDAASENMTDSIQAARMLRTTMLVPTLLFAVVQSYRLFRAQLQDTALSVVRSLLPLAMTAFLCSFSLLAIDTFVNVATGQEQMLLFGTNYAIEETFREEAIEKSRADAAKLDATHPLQLTGVDVENAFKAHPFLLPDGTRRWLRNARITITPDKAHPSGFYCVEMPWKSSLCYYSAIIHLADGTDLTESYEPRADRKWPFGHLTVYAHWRGVAGQESLMDR